MRAQLQTAKRIFQKEGIISVIKKGFHHYIRNFLYVPVVYARTKKITTKNISLLLDFVSTTSSGYLAPMQVRSEITSLLKHVKKHNPSRMMEIGTARGGTLFLWTHILRDDAHIISLDLPSGEFGGGYPWFKIPLYKSFAKKDQDITLVRGNSHEQSSVNRIRDILGSKKLDFLFIDGDHTYEGVKKDFYLYKEFVREGGIIAFHDVADHKTNDSCNVDKFWNEIKQEYQHKEFINDPNQNWAGIGLLYI